MRDFATTDSTTLLWRGSEGMRLDQIRVAGAVLTKERRKDFQNGEPNG